jgi:hypothetical protein
LDVLAEIEPVRDMVHVLEDLGLRCVSLGPVPLPLQVVRERVLIFLALHVASGARVTVPEPGAAHARAASMIFAENRGRGAVQHVQPREPSTNDDRVELTVEPVLFCSTDISFSPPGFHR